MTNIITEICDNCGEEYEFDMDLCEVIAASSIDQLASFDGVIPTYHFEAAVFCMFQYAVDILINNGWSKEELIENIQNATNELEESKGSDDSLIDLPKNLH